MLEGRRKTNRGKEEYEEKEEEVEEWEGERKTNRGEGGV